MCIFLQKTCRRKCIFITTIYELHYISYHNLTYMQNSIFQMQIPQKMAHQLNHMPVIQAAQLKFVSFCRTYTWNSLQKLHDCKSHHTRHHQDTYALNKKGFFKCRLCKSCNRDLHIQFITKYMCKSSHTCCHKEGFAHGIYHKHTQL